MDALSTAFGRDYRFPRLEPEESPEFYGMPVGQVLASNSHLIPDVAPYILNDTVIMDAGFYKRLARHPSETYTEIAKFYKSAIRAGRLRLVDFEGVLSANRATLDQMLSIDLEDIEPWVPRILESMEIWQTIIGKSTELERLILNNSNTDNYPAYFRSFGHSIRYSVPFLLRHARSIAWSAYLEFDLIKALQYKSHRNTKEKRTILSEMISQRLAYVNSNILLSRHFGASLYDWDDISPFYKRKFAQIGQDAPDLDEDQTQLQTLFSLLFPTKILTDYDAFFEAAASDRVSELKELCRSAARGEIAFDHAFAASVWEEQLKWSSEKLALSRRISWWTSPLNFVPNVNPALPFIGQKLAEKADSLINEEPHPWLFAFSSIFENPK